MPRLIRSRLLVSPMLDGSTIAKVDAAIIDATYVSYAGSTLSGSSHTFASQAIGAAAADRIVIVHVGASAGTTINSVTIGGNSATVGAATTGTNARSALYYLLVPAGTTATIVVNFSSAVARCHISVLRLTGYASGTPTDNSQPAGGGNSSRSITIDAPEGGVVIYGASGDEDAAPMAITNATSLHEEAATFETLNVGAYVTVGTTQANRVITANPCRAICGVAWA